MVNEPPFHGQRRVGVTRSLHTAFQASCTLKTQGIGPVLLMIRLEQTENAYLEPSLTPLTCTASVSSQLPTSQTLSRLIAKV